MNKLRMISMTASVISAIATCVCALTDSKIMESKIKEEVAKAILK